MKLPKHKELIHFKKTREIEGNIKTVQIKTDNVGKLYVVFTCELNYCPYIGKASNDIIGIDVGLTSLITDSNGHQVPVPARYSRYQKRLTFLQRKLSRQELGSASWERTRKQIAKKHKDVYNLRTDALHKISTQLVRDNQTIVMEDLNVQQMLQEKKYANGMAHASWSKLKELIKQKCHMYGRTLIEVDQFFPSTQKCSVCHVINPALKGNTTIRTWTCQECGSTHDRDHNAAINLLHEGKKLRMI
jgi:putative transposase